MTDKSLKIFLYVRLNCIIFLKVVCAISWPIPYKNPMRKLFFNVGFQFNYNEPFSPANFYNATYFQNIFNGRELRGESDSSDNVTMANNINEDSIDDVNKKDVKSRSLDEDQNQLVGRDLTAAQLYESIEDNFSE